MTMLLTLLLSKEACSSLVKTCSEGCTDVDFTLVRSCCGVHIGDVPLFGISYNDRFAVVEGKASHDRMRLCQPFIAHSRSVEVTAGIQ